MIDQAAADRVERERAFHDDRFTDDHERAAVGKYYSTTSSSKERYFALVDGLPSGSRVLELGCGVTGSALPLARRGLRVVAIDISPVAVDALAEAAAKEGLADRIDARVMDAEDLDLESGSIDAAIGTGILHHLDLRRAFGELTRITSSSGVGIFFEPLGRNPVINAYRSLTPAMRTPDEHPLIEADFDLAREYYDLVDVEYFHTLSLATVPFRSAPGFSSVLAAADQADQWMYERVPATKALAWTCVMRMARPRSNGGTVTP